MSRNSDRAVARGAVVVLMLLVGPLASSARADVTVPGNYPTIQAAIDAVPNGTTINVQPGTYYEALSVANTSKSFTLRGVGGSASTVVDAVGRGVALSIYRATGLITIKGLTFRNGSMPSREGGGFMIRESSPSLSDCVFESNYALNGGGGALFGSNATFTNCVIRNNIAAHFGGGLYIVAGSRPVFVASTISGNTSGTGGPGVGNNGAGGGIFSHDSSPAFRGARIVGNNSKFAAGGLFHMGVFGSGYGVASLVVEDSEVADNASSQYSAAENPAEGGGLHVEDNATATLTRVRVLRNCANTGGGLNAYRARLDVVDSVIDGNVAAPTATQPTQTGFGGGIAATSNNPQAPLYAGSSVNLTRTLVRNNTATVTGGGIAIFGDNYSTNRASLSLNGSVVSGNVSQSQGGGILANRTNVAINNSLVIRNTVSGGSLPFGGGLLLTTTSSATITGTTFASNSAGQYGGGIFLNDNVTLQMSGSRLYDNTASSFGGGGLFVGAGNVSGTVQSSIIADNVGYQIMEHGCPRTTLTYTYSSITPRPGNTDVYYSNCSGGPAATIAQLDSQSGGRSYGNNSSPPRFAHFLAAPQSGTTFTLAWSVGRATSVTVSNVGTFSQSTGTVDVAPSLSATYTLTGTASGSNGGNYGPTSVGVTVVQPPSGVTRNVAGDFNGDGRTDLAVFRPNNGTWYILHSGSGATAAYQWGNMIDRPVLGDWNNDGRADLAVYRPNNGTWYFWYSGSSTTAAYQWGNWSDKPTPGDYDGDGRADIAVFRPSNGTWYLRFSSTSTTASYQWGNQIDVPVPGDYDGDGRADLAVFRPSDGVWYVFHIAAGTTTAHQWGNANDTPVPGDYDGDGKTDLAVFRPANGTWYIRFSSTGSTGAFQWGNASDVPVPGDYDGDGRTDRAVFRPSNGTWYLWYSSSGTAAYQWGSSVDIPILKR